MESAGAGTGRVDARPFHAPAGTARGARRSAGPTGVTSREWQEIRAAREGGRGGLARAPSGPRGLAEEFGFGFVGTEPMADDRRRDAGFGFVGTNPLLVGSGARALRGAWFAMGSATAPPPHGDR